jgi:hypothetical protein
MTATAPGCTETASSHGGIRAPRDSPASVDRSGDLVELLHDAGRRAVHEGRWRGSREDRWERSERVEEGSVRRYEQIGVDGICGVDLILRVAVPDLRVELLFSDDVRTQRPR